MALITYTDKDKTGTDGIVNKYRDIDANEVKYVVNENADTISVKTWDMSTNVFPTGGKSGQVYKGVELTTRTDLTDTNGDRLPSKLVAIAIQDNPTTNAHFLFMYQIA